MKRSMIILQYFGIVIPLSSFSSVNAGEEKILSTSSHRFPRTISGKVLESRKVLDLKTNTIKHVSDDPEIPDAASLYELVLEERRLEQKDFGVLEGLLKEKFHGLKALERVRVSITLKYPEGILHPSKLETSREDLERHSANLHTIQPVIAVETFFSKYGLRNLFPSEGRSGICDISKATLKEIMFDKNVASIEEYVEFDPARVGNWISPIPFFFAQSSFPSFSTLASSAYHHGTSAVPSNAGYQVNTATVELGIAQSFLTCIGITPTYFESSNDLHSHQTFRCLTFGAPAARFHHRKSSPNPKYNEAGTLNFLTTRSIRTSSLSYMRSNFTATYVEFREMDDFAYKAPFTTFNSPTGNLTWAKEAGWQNYNGLTVGNVQHLNQSTFQINTAGYLSGCTQTRNPASRYSGPCRRSADANYNYCSSDRELPHIVAPGFTPFDNNPMAEPCDATPIVCGTSYSAPILSGMAASVIAADSRMDQWPEKVRAALLVTAENVNGNEWESITDGLDGVGVVNGAAAVAFAQTHSTVGVNWTGVVKGMGFGSINTANWGSTLNYNIAIPNTVPTGKILRVVLLWDSNPSLNSAVNELSDLDLSVYAAQPSGITKYSSSYESNIEVLHFTPSEVQAGTTISANISKYANRIHVDATTNYFYYAIAWDWVDNHAP